ncbi:hypothetical protein HHK36_017965 [Tetracentron sinense]|uniref:J domain-containing protein n=1 Tax=Tetracentron sinense TaxID=13715 RepID=A0A835D9W4_TETSI|nr:hypothetical protein HHK36_017965 [Tetracentron sinense]
MSIRKLWISTFAILRRKPRSSPLFSAYFNRNLESSRFFSCSSYHAEKSGIFESCRYRFTMNLMLYEKNFCSDSVDRRLSKCWNCGAVADSTLFLACDSCRSVQPVDSSVDYFQIFGLEKNYEIHGENIEGKYKDWQKKLHPDLVHSKSEKEKEYAAEQSARVIDAYRTLSKPLSRAMYLLELEGIHVEEGKTVSDLELLGEIMEIREAVEEATNSQALNQIQSQIQGKFECWFESFGKALQNRKFEDAVTSIQRMTYYERANEEIVKKL